MGRPCFVYRVECIPLQSGCGWQPLHHAPGDGRFIAHGDVRCLPVRGGFHHLYQFGRIPSLRRYSSRPVHRRQKFGRNLCQNPVKIAGVGAQPAFAVAASSYVERGFADCGMRLRWGLWSPVDGVSVNHGVHLWTGLGCILNTAQPAAYCSGSVLYHTADGPRSYPASTRINGLQQTLKLGLCRGCALHYAY